MLCGREPPVTAWLSAPGWRGLFKAIRLDSLDQRSSLEFLALAGVQPERAKCLEGICRGHLLALTLAACLEVSDGTSTLNTGSGQRIIEELSGLYLADIPDLQTRRAIQAASVVRRITVPLLAAMLPDLSPHDALERIRALPFLQADTDRLRIHDAVREAVASALRAENPQQYRAYRRAAYRHFMSELGAEAKSALVALYGGFALLAGEPGGSRSFLPYRGTGIRGRACHG